jgi:hypothetical protein
MVPASSLVFLALIPALLYSLMSFHGNHKWFFVVLSAIILLCTIGLYLLMVTGNIHQLGETITMLGYLYQLIYPYQLNVNLLGLLGWGVLFGSGIFIILLLCFGWMFKLDEFKLAVSASYLVMFFTSFFLIMNIFFYLIPILRDFVLTNPVLQWIIILFYGILPYLTFTLSLLWLCCCWDMREKAKQQRDTQTLNRDLGNKHVGSLSKWLAVGAIMVLVIIAIALIVEF